MAISVLSAFGATIPAASASRADVQAAIDLASDGDTVEVPAGTGYWDTYVEYSKGIWIKGAGMEQTVFVDEANPRSGLISLVTVAGKNYRLSGFTIQLGVTNTGSVEGGTIPIQGNSKAVRIDHVKFDRVNARGIYFIGTDVYAVIDHCTFWMNLKQGVEVQHSTWDGGTYGDKSWAQAMGWGTTNQVVIEDCVFTNAGPVGVIDSVGGARWTFRFNKVTNDHVATHGTESTGRTRGLRGFELYGNTFHMLNPDFTNYVAISLVRSGTGVVYSNTTLGYEGLIAMVDYQSRVPFWYGGGPNGTNAWATNHSDGLYLSGTHNGTNGSPRLVDTTKSWSVNQWLGKTVQNTNLLNWNNWGWIGYGEVSSSDATSMTFASPVQGTNILWNNGDRYLVYQVEAVIDQVGRSEGDLISGDPPTPIAWPNQVSEPLSAWNNTKNGSPIDLSSSGYQVIRAGRDYTNAVKAGYTALVYPHPLVTAQDGAAHGVRQITGTFSLTGTGRLQ